jgi:hypothetical protein
MEEGISNRLLLSLSSLLQLQLGETWATKLGPPNVISRDYRRLLVSPCIHSISSDYPIRTLSSREVYHKSLTT